MALTVSGLSHHSSPVELRECVAMPDDRLPMAFQDLRRRVSGCGAAIVNTCNRMEIYVHADAPAPEIFAAVRALIAEWHGIAEEEFLEHLFEYQDDAAVSHLFRVAASLDSMVVGEDQILGQVHDAFAQAQAAGAPDKVLSAAFQRAFKVAKEIRTKSSIGQGRVSVASVAVDLAVSIFMDLADKTVLIIGSGDTGETALKSLIERGVGGVIVANRTVARASDLADRYNGEAVALKDLDQHLFRADIIVSSTAATEPILQAEDFQRALKARDLEPMFVIDIAVPRDIADNVNDLDNVYLYNIDDLQKVADENMASRKAEVATCLETVARHAERFMAWVQGLQAQPTIVSMQQEFDAIRERELAKTLKALPDLTEKQRGEVEYLTKRIVNTILQRPMTQIKREVTQEDPHRVIHLVKRLFGLEEGS